MIKKYFVNLVVIFTIIAVTIAFANEDDILGAQNMESGELINYNNISHDNAQISLTYQPNEQKVIDNVPTISCKSAYVVEPITGKVLYEKNAHEKMFPASTTKILTALLAMENCQMTDKVTISQNAISQVPEGYTNAKLKAGEELSVKDLLYCLLLPSANEVAIALAEHISGSIEAFSELANSRAEELGCETLHFINPNGVHDEDHYCSAYDLFLIAKECTKYDVFNEIVKTKEFTVPATDIYPQNDRVLKNTNSMILPEKTSYYYPYCIGIKTGFTTNAGECFVGRSYHNGIELISVVLGGGTNSKGLNERFYDTAQLWDFVYKNYSIKELINETYSLATISVGNATKGTATLDAVVNTNIFSIVPNDINMENINISVFIPDDIKAPIIKNQVIGQATLHADGLNYTTDIVASHPVYKQPYWLYNTIAAIIIIIILLFFKSLISHSDNHKVLFLALCFIFMFATISFAIYYTKINMSKSASNIVIEKQNVELKTIEKE